MAFQMLLSSSQCFLYFGGIWEGIANIFAKVVPLWLLRHAALKSTGFGIGLFNSNLKSNEIVVLV